MRPENVEGGFGHKNIASSAAPTASLSRDPSTLSSRITLFDARVPVSKSARIAAGAKEFRERWLDEYKSPRFFRLSAFSSAKPSNAISRMYDALNRSQGSILIQLCTGRIGLNVYLYRFHLSPCPFPPLFLVP
ncbi:hypothetical protein DFH07DRAFT_753775 [Mycena maculata]|uniref:Uncharacterized protein n=1 Tax=Mycena maculata TaxID=230809 RepID=A0AAD7MWU8_9AGAR|nr:hypothetical protein DFH07DRAFT_753775 [Mycena maculata]